MHAFWRKSSEIQFRALKLGLFHRKIRIWIVKLAKINKFLEYSWWSEIVVDCRWKWLVVGRNRINCRPYSLQSRNTLFEIIEIAPKSKFMILQRKTIVQILINLPSTEFQNSGFRSGFSKIEILNTLLQDIFWLILKLIPTFTWITMNNAHQKYDIRPLISISDGLYPPSDKLHQNLSSYNS